MKTIKEAAESAAQEIESALTPEERYTESGMADVIARHFADYAALRDAADRALEIGERVQGDYDPGPIPGPEPTERDYLYCDFEEALTALRGLLNTQPIKQR